MSKKGLICSTCSWNTSEEDSTVIYFNRIDSIEAIELNDLGINCYSSCEPCENQSVLVTFTVDMSSEVVSEEGVFVMGVSIHITFQTQ